MHMAQPLSQQFAVTSNSPTYSISSASGCISGACRSGNVPRLFTKNDTVLIAPSGSVLNNHCGVDLHHA